MKFKMNEGHLFLCVVMKDYDVFITSFLTEFCSILFNMQQKHYKNNSYTKRKLCDGEHILTRHINRVNLTSIYIACYGTNLLLFKLVKTKKISINFSEKMTVQAL